MTEFDPGLVDPHVRELLDLESSAPLRDVEARAARVWADVERRMLEPPEEPGSGDPDGAGGSGAGRGAGSGAGSVPSSAPSSASTEPMASAATTGLGSAHLIWWVSGALFLGALGGWWLRGAAQTDTGAQTAVPAKRLSTEESRTEPVLAGEPSPPQPNSTETEDLLPSPGPSGAVHSPEPDGLGDGPLVPHGMGRAPGRPAPRPARAAVGPSPAPSVEEPEELPDSVPVAAAREDEAAEPPQVPPVPSIAEESELVRSARRALREGQVTTALAALRRHDRRFPRGTLLEERERLLVEALVRSGDLQTALARAAAFLSTYPNSVQASAVRRWTAEAATRLEAHADEP